ncbi:Vacuolar protein sorting-associated protein [Pleurostoma richardsiae]|uniref:Vacuolar protein sorting-associated protein n=1 Tax=Pleurostoma richardsiae TaxID=41990 RepID=A0AA38R9M1_9PEZI|nr:Vacuolar protein sorting-associated protein [Pleurostoma richardsiae]
MYYLRRAVILAVLIGIIIISAAVLPKALNPLPPSPEEKRRDKRWVRSSPYWADRQVCRWFGLCGVHHLRWDAPALPGEKSRYDEIRPLELRSLRRDRGAETSWEIAGTVQARRQGAMSMGTRRGVAEQPQDHSGASQDELQDIPDYVLRHAPLVHLFSGENFWPADIAEHVQHMTPFVNGSVVNASEPLSLANLHKLDLPGRTFLTSIDDVEERPEWLHSHGGIPGSLAGPQRQDIRDQSIDEPASSDDDSNWDTEGGNIHLHKISDPLRLSRSVSPDPHLLAGRAVRDKRLQRDGARQRAEQQLLSVMSEVPDGKPNASGYSGSPAVLVMVDKGSGILDAFWFFFYSYNLGQTVFDIRFGNHVGDWEHCMVRFEHGHPRAMFLSEHEGGQAYAWAALEKKNVEIRGTSGNTLMAERPVIYSAVGSHAMYAFPGDHPYILPFKLLKDQTDRGPLWDPSLNHYAYFYDYRATPPADDDTTDERSIDASSPYPFDTGSLERVPIPEATEKEPQSLTPAGSNPDAPTSWFHFDGTWGDELYGLGDIRQWRLFGQYHYVTGPLGPKFKHLGREKVCQTDRCRVLQSIEEGKRKSWYS